MHKSNSSVRRKRLASSTPNSASSPNSTNSPRKYRRSKRTKRLVRKSTPIKSHFMEDNLNLLFDNLKGKTIGLMSGCFCPPHKGHYKSFLKMLKDPELNLDILVLESVNDEKVENSRHGTPLSHTNFALNMFADYLEKKTGKKVIVRNARGALYKDKGYNLLQYTYIPNTVKRVYRIRILDEKYEKNNSLKNPKDLKKINRMFFRNLRDGINEYKYQEKIFFRTKIEQKDEDKLSATKFVNAMVKGKDVSKFINHLSPKDQKRYVRKTLKHYGTYLH